MPTTSLIDGSFALITRSQRSINSGGANALIPDVMIEEIATDTLRITDHPVEMGAAISDHAFKIPVEIIMRCGFSDSNGRFEGYTRQIYEYLYVLQNQRTPFTVTTPFRTYTNMLIGMLTKTADESLSHGMMIVVAMREVILTNTSVTTSSGVDSGSISLPSITVPPIVGTFGAPATLSSIIPSPSTSPVFVP